MVEPLPVAVTVSVTLIPVLVLFISPPPAPHDHVGPGEGASVGPAQVAPEQPIWDSKFKKRKKLGNDRFAEGEEKTFRLISRLFFSQFCATFRIHT